MAWKRKDERPPIRAAVAVRFGRSPASLGQLLGGTVPGSSQLSTEQVARKCGVDRQTVVRWVTDGCPASGGTKGEPLRFDLLAVLAWRKENGL